MSSQDDISPHPKSVFISYTHADRAFAQRLDHDLHALGIPVKIDFREIGVGDSITEWIEHGISQSTWMIVVLSPEALASNWVQRELRTGLVREIRNKTVFLLPALYKKVELPELLQDKFYADFRNDYDEGFKCIRDRVVSGYRHDRNDSWLLVKRPKIFNLFSDLGGYTIYPRGTLHRSEVIREELKTLGYKKVMAYGVRAKPESKRAPSTAETWFGVTGRLILTRSGAKVTGQYDWHGISLAGSIHGELVERTIRFKWDWSESTEKGFGMFWTTVPNVLHGGWWMDYEGIDFEDLIEARTRVPNQWQFVNVDGLEIDMGS